MANGTLAIAARLNTGTAAGSVGILNQTGGTLDLQSLFQISDGAAGASSTVNLSSGILNVGTPTAASIFLCSRGTGVFNVTLTGEVRCGTFDVSRNIGTTVGKVNLDGGTMLVNRVGTATGSANATQNGSVAIFNFNGGILRARQDNTTFFQGSTASPALPITTLVKSGGAIIDSSTFDISVLKLISTSEGDIYQVLATNGDTHLGGDDIDNLLQAFVHEKVLRQHRVDFSSHAELAQELRKELISIKHQLSEKESATLRFPLPNGAVFVQDFEREAFEALIRPIVDRTMGPVRQALVDAKLKPIEIDEVVLVGGTTRTPVIRRTVQEYFDRKPHTELNPDEVVALGAAVQANILDRGVSNMLLLDVTPLSLGIETYGGAVAKVIPRNSTIPASAQEMYTTGVDNQTGIDIHVLQGERELAKDCRSLARFTLRVPPAPAGLPRIEVKFLIDANGILQVGAKDTRTGEQRSMEVQPSYGISDTEIERMLEESIEYAEQDFAERQAIEARTEAETILAATQKALASEQAANLPHAERENIDATVAALKESVSGSDYKLIRKRIDELNQATMHLAELVMNSAVSTALQGRKLAEV